MLHTYTTTSVNEGLLWQRGVRNTVNVCRKIVGHLKTLATCVFTLREHSSGAEYATQSSAARCTNEVEQYILHDPEPHCTEKGPVCIHIPTVSVVKSILSREN